MKFKFIKVDILTGTVKVDTEGVTPTIKYAVNVTWEYVAEGVVIPTEYKTVTRTTPLLDAETTDAVTAMEKAEILGLVWLEETFGESNIIV